ncbi:hypothetical protein Plhal304r1_c099g0174541 [Plasmopara halstedii]
MRIICDLAKLRVTIQNLSVVILYKCCVSHRMCSCNFSDFIVQLKTVYCNYLLLQQYI